MLRSTIDGLYQTARGLEDPIDPAIPSSALGGFLFVKLVARIRAASRGFPRAYFGHRVRLAGRAQLRVGRSVSIADGVSITAFGTEGITLGDHVTVDRLATLRVTAVVRHSGVGIRVGPRSAIGAYNVLLGQGGLLIGSDCLLGPHVTVVTENHVIARPEVPIREQGELRSAVTIEDDVWIGAGATILAGAFIGRGAVIAAGAVVRGKVEPFDIVGGVPARPIGKRGASS